MTQTAILIAVAATAVLSFVTLCIVLGSRRQHDDALRRTKDDLIAATDRSLNAASGAQTAQAALVGNQVTAAVTQMEQRIGTLEKLQEQKLDAIRETVEKRLQYLQEDNNRRLESMQKTVDETLQKSLEDTMSRSFQLVNERLEQVYKGLGEMQTLASGVGDLKRCCPT